MRRSIGAPLLLLLLMAGIGGAVAQSPGNQAKASGMEADVTKIKQAMLGNWESIAPEVRPSAAMNAAFSALWPMFPSEGMNSSSRPNGSGECDVEVS